MEKTIRVTGRAKKSVQPDIQDINYSWNTFSISNNNGNRISFALREAQCDVFGGFSDDMEIVVGDIDINGEVSIVYGIK